jgi:hypothetical protein
MELKIMSILQNPPSSSFFVVSVSPAARVTGQGPLEIFVFFFKEKGRCSFQPRQDLSFDRQTVP